MYEEILVAGFGGQGVVFAGRLLSEAALAEGRGVASTVSYGPEMRGGTANSCVIISDEPIGSLVASQPTVAIVMNKPSMDRFEPRVRAGGLLLVNRSLIPYRSKRKDIISVYVPATKLALTLGDKTVANLVLIGALVAVKPIVSIETVGRALEEILRKENPGMVETNQKALRLGMAAAPAVKMPSASLTSSSKGCL